MGASLPRFQLLAAPLPGVEPGFVFAPRPWESNGEAGLRLCSAHIYLDSGHTHRTRSGAGPEVESGLVVLEKDTDRTDPSFKHTNHLQTQLDANRTGYSKILTSKHAISPTLPHDRKRHSHRQSLLVCVFVCEFSLASEQLVIVWTPRDNRTMS